MKESTKKWHVKIAMANGTTVEEVLKYLKSLSSTGRVLHHLKLES